MNKYNILDEEAHVITWSLIGLSSWGDCGVLLQLNASFNFKRVPIMRTTFYYRNN